MTTRIRSLLLVALLALAAPAAAQVPDAPTLLSALGFSQSEIQQVMAGQIVRSDSMKPASDREIVAGMAFLVKDTPKDFVAKLKSGLAVKVDPQTQQTGLFNGAGSAGDVAKLTLDPNASSRAQAYVNASPGGDLNLSAQEIATFNALQPSPAAVTPAVQQQLLARMQAYQTKGLDGIAPYARSSGTRSPAEEIRTMTKAAAALQRYVPAAYQMLLSYPNSKPAGTEETFRWSQINAHDTPTYTLTHALFVPDGNAYVVVQRMFYVSAGFNAEQAIAALVPVQGGTVMVYGNRTSTDQVTGFGGGAKRSIGSRLLESQLESLAGKVSTQ
ncbi:MAG TPA: hypothetical protein VFY49_15610 [Myxococcota bacterium]|nr:hypothetical protein [Myxococcota bacterium]